MWFWNISDQFFLYSYNMYTEALLIHFNLKKTGKLKIKIKVKNLI